MVGVATVLIQNCTHSIGSGKIEVAKSAWVHFSIGLYHDDTDFDVVPMQACSLLLGHPWEYDNNTLNYGRANKYTFMHTKKRIVLLHLSPAEIVKYEKQLTEHDKIEPSPKYSALYDTQSVLMLLLIHVII